MTTPHGDAELRRAGVVPLPSAEPVVPLDGTEEWLTTLNNPHDTTAPRGPGRQDAQQL